MPRQKTLKERHQKNVPCDAIIWRHEMTSSIAPKRQNNDQERQTQTPFFLPGS
jgi:hypothetical protein